VSLPEAATALPVMVQMFKLHIPPVTPVMENRLTAPLLPILKQLIMIMQYWVMVQ
jgi:hypothetical protein